MPHVPIALTIGAFDGIHLGHQHLIRQACSTAERIGGESAVLTFEPHPDRVLHPEQHRLYLTTSQERTAILEQLGVDHLIVLRFDRELAQVSAEDFMTAVCRAMDLRELWVGPDARLGAGGRGTASVLRRIGEHLGYSVHEVSRLRIGDQPVSSTAIRQMLAAGAVDEAARLLGRPFTLSGEVVHSDHRGATIGFPTANVDLSSEQLLPADGVYACRVYLPGSSFGHPAVTNVGVRPTFGLVRRTVEAHLLDWSGDLYGRTIRVAFLQRLRGEQKFAGLEALVTQIRDDAAAARRLLSQDEREPDSSATPS
jgi:riboflavin kinase/FMN adenylyltransferase